jgi:hypothetical protein
MTQPFNSFALVKSISLYQSKFREDCHEVLKTSRCLIAVAADTQTINIARKYVMASALLGINPAQPNISE